MKNHLTSRIGISALALLATGSAAFGQATSGNLSIQAAANWSTAPWNITSGPGTFPSGSGIATLNEQVNLTGTLPAVPALTADTPFTLAGLTLNSIYQYTVAGAAGNLNIDTSGAGFVLNVSLSNGSSPTLFAAGHVISAIIGGGTGGAGFVKTGNGIVTLSGANTFTGDVHINGGVLRSTNGDAAFGNAANNIFLNGGTLRFSTTAATTSRNFILEAGGGTIELFANATLNGIISGSGSLTRTVGSILTLTGANTYTGSTTQVAGTLTLSGANGSIATSSAYDFGGTVSLDNATANNSNRLSDTAPITSRGATFTVSGNAAAATAEQAGALTLAQGTTIMTVTPNAAQPASLNFSSITRQNNATMFIRGTNLGATPANGVAQIGSTAAPAGLVGGGGAAGSTNISILPWAVGNLGAGVVTGSSMVTYAGGNFRPLSASEYAATVGGSATDNVRFTAAATAGAGTVNSLVFAPGAAATLSGGVVSITSGAFMYSPTANVTGTVSAGLDFGAAQGIIHTSATLGISGVISGSNGVVYNGFNSTTTTVSGANTYTGSTIVNAGTLAFGGTIDAATAGPLGQTSAPIILNIGSLTNTRIWVNADSTINRNIIITGSPNSSFTAGLGATATFNITINGNIDLQRRMTVENGSTLPMTINGVVSGPGSINDAFATLLVLNGNNTYSGGTEINTGTYRLGSDTALGTGTVFFSGLGFIQGSGTAARVIPNNFTYNTATATFNGTAPMTFTGTHNLNGNRTFAVLNTAATNFAGLIDGGSITKTGTGTLSLTRANGNTYTGGTILGANAGILNVVNTTGSGTGAGVVNVGTGSTLAGAFTIAGPANVTGTLAPGDGGAGAIGTANFGGNLTLAGTSIVNLEIAAANSADRVTVAGTLTLGGSTINLVSLGGFTVQAGQVFDVVDWGTLAGTATINTSGLLLGPGVTLDTSNFFTNGTITAVPEPTTIGFLAAAGLGLVAFRRRRQA